MIRSMSAKSLEKCHHKNHCKSHQAQRVSPFRNPHLCCNFLACAFLVWGRLTQVAYQTGQTISQVKHGLWEDDLRQQLKTPSVRMTLA